MRTTGPGGNPVTSVRVPLIAGLVLALAACAQPPLPQDHFYRLQVVGPETPMTAPRLNGTLEVERFIADGLTAGRPIVFSNSGKPQELREYHYHFWVEPPTVMLRDQLVTYLRAAKVATTVVTPEVRVEPDYVLTARIRRLERIVGTPPRAAVEIELGVRRTRDDRLLFQGTYGVETKAEDGTVGGAVAAINRALTEIYAKVVADISRI